MFICSAQSNTANTLLLILAVALLASVLAVLVIPVFTDLQFVKRKPMTPALIERLIARAQKRPWRFSGEGNAAFMRAKRFMLKSDQNYSPALSKENIRYKPQEVWINGENLRRKNGKPIRLYAQILNCADVKPMPDFTVTEQAASKIVGGEKWAIVAHGYRGEGSEMLLEAYFFMERGYNVLLLDLRGHGKSEGAYVGLGWHDRLDIVRWAEYLSHKNAGCKILLYGVSMGGAAVAMALGEKLPSNVRLAIADCAYTSAWDELCYRYKKQTRLPPFPILTQANLYAKWMFGYSFKEASVLKQVQKNTTLPILFLHGGRDKFVPAYFTTQLYEATATRKKEMLFLDGAGHAEAMRFAYADYWQKTDGFLEKYF